MINNFEHFLNETRYFLENIDKKYYVFYYNKKNYLIQILKLENSKRGIYYSVFNHYNKKLPFSHYPALWEPELKTHYTISLSNWKRHLSDIVFSTNNINDAIDYMDSKKIKNPDIDPYGEEDWGDLNETRYFLENIDKKYYVFKDDIAKWHLIEIIHVKNNIKGKYIFYDIIRGSDDMDKKYYIFGYGELYRVSISKWKRNKYQIKFSTNDKKEALDYYNGVIRREKMGNYINNFKNKKHLKSIDPYDEENWD